MANNQAANQAAATNAYSQSAQAQQQNLLNSIAQQNNAHMGMQSNINNVNAGLASNVMTGQQNILGGITGGIGSALGLAEGGMIPKYAEGTGSVQAPSLDNSAGSMIAQAQAPATAPGPKSNVGKHMSGMMPLNWGSGASGQTNATGATQFGQGIGKGIGAGIKAIGSGIKNAMAPTADAAAPTQLMMDSGTALAAEGGKVPALVSPGERYLPPKEVAKVVKGQKSPMEAGEKIPGKPKVGGAKNSYANDTVPKTLEEGGIVLPRSVTQSKNPEWAAHKFVRDVMAKKHRRG
jgi:hypothetical protein